MKYLLTILLFSSLTANATHVYIGSTGGGAIVVNNFISTYGNLDTFFVKTGTYTYFDWQVSGRSSKIWVLPSDTGVTFTVCCGGVSLITNMSNVEFGAFYFYNGAFRGIEVDGDCDSLTFKGTRFKSFPDYGMWFQGLTYNGNENTRNDNITLDGVSFDSMYSSAKCILFANQSKFLTIKNCTFNNTIAVTSNTIELNFADKVNIFNNRATNINITGTSHNAFLYIKGNGNIYNNYGANVQGDFCRGYAYLIDSSSTNRFDTLWFFNNREVGSRKYAMFEFQQFDTDTTTGSSIPNIKTATWVVSNNSACNLRTSDYTPWGNSTGGGGSMFDRYTVYKNMIIVNNKAWRLYIDSIPNPASPPPAFTFNYIFHVGGGTNPSWLAGAFGDTSNNVYSIDAPAAGIADTLVMNITPTSAGAYTGTSRFAYKYSTDYSGTAIAVWQRGAATANKNFFNWIRDRFRKRQLN